MYFKNPWAWSYFFFARIARYVSETESIIFVSIHARYNTYLGKGLSFGFFMMKNNTTTSIACRKSPPADVSRVSLFTSHPFHERCWALFERVIGKYFIENNSTPFFKSLFSSKRMIHYSAREKCLYEPSLWFKFLEMQGNKFHLQMEKFRSEYEKWLRTHNAPGKGYDRHRRYPARDPINIPELRDVIYKAKECRRTGEEKEQRLTVGLSRWQHHTPFDIQIPILEHLQDPKDIRNALEVLPWNMPDLYWQCRFPNDIVFEFDGLQKHEVDWRYLYLAVVDLMNTSYGLRNRCRTIELLEKVKHRFNKRQKRRRGLALFGPSLDLHLHVK